MMPGNWHAPSPNVAGAGHAKMHHQAKLAWIAKTDPKLHRAYLLKEALREIFQMNLAEATEA